MSSKVRLGELDALVVPGLKENLLSLSDLTAKGSTVKLSDTEGVISNPVNEKKIHMFKDFGTWRLKPSDLATYDHEKGDQVNAFYSVLPKTKAKRFISLHERLGHQPAKVLAEMLDEDNHVCIRAGLTAREVHVRCVHVGQT